MKIFIELDMFEHLLHCLANQKFIQEMDLGNKKECQEQIDQAWREGMDLLQKYKYPPVYAKKMFDGSGKHAITHEKLDQIKEMGENVKYKLFVNGKQSGTIQTDNVAEFIEENYKTNNFEVNEKGKTVHLTISIGQAMSRAFDLKKETGTNI